MVNAIIYICGWIPFDPDHRFELLRSNYHLHLYRFGSPERHGRYDLMILGVRWNSRKPMTEHNDIKIATQQWMEIGIHRNGKIIPTFRANFALTKDVHWNINT